MSKEKQSPESTKTEDKAENKNPAQEEFGGFKSRNLPEPTRYGDWEVGGRCSDF